MPEMKENGNVVLPGSSRGGRFGCHIIVLWTRTSTGSQLHAAVASSRITLAGQPRGKQTCSYIMFETCFSCFKHVFTFET